MPDRTRPNLQEAFRRATSEAGENGKGRNGTIGYLRQWAKSEPASFCALLGRYLRSCTLQNQEHREDIPPITSGMSAHEAMQIYQRILRSRDFDAKHPDPQASPLLLAAQQVGED